jgi:hypothetical protein
LLLNWQGSWGSNQVSSFQTDLLSFSQSSLTFSSRKFSLKYYAQFCYINNSLNWLSRQPLL